jgi:hypothetical protein
MCVILPGRMGMRGAVERRLGVVLIHQDKPEEILHFKKGRLVSREAAKARRRT